MWAPLRMESGINFGNPRTTSNAVPLLQRKKSTSLHAYLSEVFFLLFYSVCDDEVLGVGPRVGRQLVVVGFIARYSKLFRLGPSHNVQVAKGVGMAKAQGTPYPIHNINAGLVQAGESPRTACTT